MTAGNGMLQFSVLSGALHESWRHQAPEGVADLDDSARSACEVLKTKRLPKVAPQLSALQSKLTADLHADSRGPVRQLWCTYSASSHSSTSWI